MALSTRPTIQRSDKTTTTRSGKAGAQTLSVPFRTRGDVVIPDERDLYAELEGAATSVDAKVKPFGTALVFSVIRLGMATNIATLETIRAEAIWAREQATLDSVVLADELDADADAVEAYQNEMREYLETLASDYLECLNELHQIITVLANAQTDADASSAPHCDSFISRPIG